MQTAEDKPAPGPPGAVSAKRRIRREMRARRRALPADHLRRAADELARRLSCLPLVLGSARIAFYVAMDGEIDPLPAMLAAAARGTHCHVPVMPRGRDRRLWFAPIEANTVLRPNRHGIAEPAGSLAGWRRANQLDLLCVPLVAFDARGNRLGMGGGYYDTTLAGLRDRRYRRPRAVGIAHECQRVERLRVDPWDVPLEAVVTDAGIYRGTGLGA